jgi:hypothetical protein
MCLVYSNVVNCGRLSFHDGWIMPLEAHMLISVLIQVVKLNITQVIKNNNCVGLTCLHFLFSPFLTRNLRLI